MNERTFPAKKREWVFDAIKLIKMFGSVRKKSKNALKKTKPRTAYFRKKKVKTSF